MHALTLAFSRHVAPLVFVLGLGCTPTEGPRAAHPAALKLVPAAPTPQRSATPLAPADPAAALPVAELGNATLRPLEPWPWTEDTAPKARTPVAQGSGDWKLQKTMRVGASHLSVADLSRDGRFAMVVSELDVSLRLFQLPEGRLVAQTPLPGVKTFEPFDAALWPIACEFPAAPTPCVLLASMAGLATLNAHTGEVIQQLSSVPADRLRFSVDKLLLAAGSSQIPTQTSQFVLYRVTPGPKALSPVLLASFSERVDDWVVSPSRKLLAVLYYPSNRVEVLDLESLRSLFSVPTPEFAHGLDFSADERWLAIGGERLELLRVDKPEERRTFEKFGNNIHQVRFNAASGQWFTSSYDGKVRIFTLNAEKAQLQLVQTLSHAGTANVYALGFTEDGTRLLSSSGDQTLKLWGY